MLSRLVCRRNRGANGSKKAASSGSASGEALGTLLIFMLHSTTETNKVVLVFPLADVLCSNALLNQLWYAFYEAQAISAVAITPLLWRVGRLVLLYLPTYTEVLR